ncbi:hypothetical protein F0562_032250 [Nyssa sinensis]|uniref:Uncharacterized protein n=1 Tax=Nyssa sinensis TaxID=561372 RepID=A0A5J5AMA4_9ASTE|nr:hypothetical protein F0562_032250 [Nyssa sinensis]
MNRRTEEFSVEGTFAKRSTKCCNFDDRIRGLEQLYPPSPMEMVPAVTSAMPVVRIMADEAFIPDSPAVRAMGTGEAVRYSNDDVTDDLTGGEVLLSVLIQK